MKCARCRTRALELSLAHGERGDQAWALGLLGVIASHFECPDVEPGEGHYWGCVPSSLTATMASAKLYRRAGRRQQARGHLTSAATMDREMGMTYWLERVEAESSGLT